MENFFIEENFYSDLGEYIDSFLFGENFILALSDTWYQNAEEADLEPVLKMYYPNGKRFTITKKDLLEWIEPTKN